MSNITQKKCSGISIKSKIQPVSQALPHSLHLLSAALYFICLLLFTGALAACGQESGSNDSTPIENSATESPENNSGNGQSMDAPGTGNGQKGQPSSPESALAENAPSENISPDNALKENAPSGNDKSDEMKSKFGENCIADQTFKVELSQYEGKVYFVPFAPSQDNPDFHIQLIQGGKVLAEIPQYIPESLTGETFSSLDAVSFYDINYDGTTDILLIETYGSTSFAAVYYGERSEYYEKNFFPQVTLSENITRQIQPLTVSEIRSFLSFGKKNGDFSNYQEAYRAISRLCTMEDENAKDLKFNLIYFDDDEIPELVTGVNGYYMSLYTFQDKTAYRLMDDWGYGAMGNAGYEYSPRNNSLRNYNSDYAGAIVYTTYMTIGSQHSLETTAQIETFNFDDVNGNDMPDEEEYDSVGNYSVSYLGDTEITNEEWNAYEAGEYVFIETVMSLEELMAELE